MKIAVIGLNQPSVTIGRQVVSHLPEATLYGLRSRTTDVDISFDEFTLTVQELFQQGTAIVGLCAAGILIRTIAPLLNNKWQEPPVLAIAEDGSAVVPLLGGLQGANHLARQIGAILQTEPAITTSGDIRFKTALLAPPVGYTLVNPDDAKGFLSDLLSGAKVRLEGEADWLTTSELPIDPNATLMIQVTEATGNPSPTCLVYHPVPPELGVRGQIPPELGVWEQAGGKLFVIGTGPGSTDWMTPEVTRVLQQATDWVGYTTYLNLVEPLRQTQTRHDSDNREELDRARFALDLAASGKSVVVVSSGDPGIYAMAAAVLEAMETDRQWPDVQVQICPGISAMQAAAAQIGAPIGHDFCAISLSDILKPWEMIEHRIKSAAAGDFVIAFYNPISSQRRWQLDQAKEILLQYRDGQTPIVLAKNVGRSGQQIQVKRLQELRSEDADMRTVLLIGSSKTRIFDHGDRRWVYTPRRYEL
jgi:cobalt-precorrin 5A hydrolase / precorrin-3B C17-methyltransferase